MIQAMTLRQIAELCGVSRSLVHRHVRQGKLFAQMVGRIYLVNHADVDAYVAKYVHKGQPGRPRKEPNATEHPPST